MMPSKLMTLRSRTGRGGVIFVRNSSTCRAGISFLSRSGPALHAVDEAGQVGVKAQVVFGNEVGAQVRTLDTPGGEYLIDVFGHMTWSRPSAVSI